MRVVLYLFTIAVVSLAACRDASGPDGSTITLQSDRITCSRTTSFEVTIDGVSRGSFEFTPGSEWTFPVTAGDHQVRAVGDEDSGFAIIDREVTVPEEGTFTVLLTCHS